MLQLPQAQTEFERDGFTIFKRVVSQNELERLAKAVEKVRLDKNSPGLRNLLNRSSDIRDFATSGIALAVAKELLGYDPIPVRAILFDKTPASNWYVTWHQDLSIPVRSRFDHEGYGPWSSKEGIVHVQPPSTILERMVSLRIHLDDCTKQNGAIKFVAGSHLKGIFDAAATKQLMAGNRHIIYPADRGDIIAMRPLVLHSSSAAESPDSRRVLHLEYAGTKLPHGLQWAEA